MTARQLQLVVLLLVVRVGNDGLGGVGSLASNAGNLLGDALGGTLGLGLLVDDLLGGLDAVDAHEFGLEDCRRIC